jgi:transglutaminase-like putative cysteine protease
MLLSRTTLQLRVDYDAPAFNCRRVLRILPQSRPGQRVVTEKLAIFPEPQLREERTDEAGNRRLLVVHRRIERSFQLALDVATETWPELVPRDTGTPERGLGLFLLPSRFADLSDDLRRRGRESATNLRGAALAESLGEFVFQNLTYEVEPHTPPPAASTLLQDGTGSCQDFAHLMISLCRAAGLPARYVAGFNPAEGQLHAWVEVFVEKRWQAFDPTHGRRPSAGCVVVATGRDYQDARPVVGDYWGGGAHLKLHCRTEVAE